MIGARGMDSTYSGLETTVREVSIGLVRRGHEVTVFSASTRERHQPAEVLDGVRIERIPTLPGKHTETLIRAGLSSIASGLDSYDVINYHAEGPGLFAAVSRLCGKRTVVTIHGLDWKRAKWTPIASACLRMAERVAVRSAHRIVVVSRSLQRYFVDRYGRETAFIPNASISRQRATSSQQIETLGLTPGGYCLFASRLVPEKGCHDLIQAYNTLETEMRLVIAGGARYQDAYAASLRRAADPNRVSFVGHVTGPLLQELFSHAYLFVLPSYIEGLSNALLEAMSYQKCVLVSDIPENLEVLQGNGFWFRTGDVGDLAASLNRLLDEPTAVLAMEARLAQEQGPEQTWDAIAGKYEALYRSMS
jgi:glycosyltransferase involved in cell wall biosynthesis